MKQLTMLLTALLITVIAGKARAQQYKYKLGNSADKSIEFTVSRSDVVIEGHDSDEVVIRNLDYEAPPKRAQGLRALYNSAEDNTGIGLSVEEDGGTLKIVTASRDEGDYRLLVPNKVRLKLDEVNWGGGDFEIKNHQGEIEINSKNADMKLTDVTGPIIANSTSGDMDIKLTKLSQAGPTSISLVSGYIDVTMPADSKANFSLNSISGEIYTDLDISLKGDKENHMQRIGGSREVNGSLNGGGADMNLKTISGDIYLRKSK